jgi:hypothetical protein
MNRRNFLHVAGGGVIFAATGCSTALPPEAIAAWRGPQQGDPDVRRWALSYAILAPHSHNLQSWLVDLRTPGEILLHCDTTRLLPQTDPLSRQIMMSQGTFLELLDLAARERGHRAEIALFPQGVFDGGQPDTRPVARIKLLPDPAVTRDPLFAQILQRRTNREAYKPRHPAPPALQAISQAAAAGGARIGFTGADAAALQRHRAIAAEAWRIELTTPHTLLESYRVLRIGPGEIAQHRDGISLNKPFVRAVTALGLFDRSKAPAADDANIRQQIEEFEQKLAATPAFFWLVTPGNDRATQVQAGRAYARAQLAATAHGLSMHPLSQALQEYPEQAKPYADVHAMLAPGGGIVQMWARLGHAPAIEPSPRRGLAAHVMA